MPTGDAARSPRQDTGDVVGNQSRAIPKGQGVDEKSRSEQKAIAQTNLYGLADTNAFGTLEVLVVSGHKLAFCSTGKW